MRVFAYMRCSTEKEHKQGSIEIQREAIEKYCEFHGYEIVKVYIDPATSALDYRPALEEMMKGLDAIDGVVVSKLDRFGRSVKDLVNNVYMLKNKGIDFISVKDNLDTTTPNGRLLFHILSAFAEFDREMIRERMEAGREKAKREGKILHRPRKDIDPDELKEMYLPKSGGGKELSASACAKYFDVTKPTILSRLREMGIKIRHRGVQT